MKILSNLKTFDSLSNHAFRILFAATAMDHISISIQMMARTWYIYDLTGMAYMIGIIGTFTGITFTSSAILGGALADRFEKRTLLLIGTAVAFLSGLALSIDIFLGYIHWSHLMLSVVFLAVTIGVTQSARQSMLPFILKSDQLLNGVSLNAAMSNLTNIVAPAAAGFLIGWYGVGYVYLSMTILYAMQFILLFSLPSIGIVDRKDNGQTIAKDILEGFKYLRSHWIVLQLIIFGFVAVVFGMPFQFLLPVFTETVLNTGPEGFGYLLSFMAIGSLIASLSTASMGNFQHKGLLLIGLGILFGASMFIFSFYNNYLIAALLMIPIGIGQSARMTVNTALIQSRVEKRFQGRVISLYTMTAGLNPIGMLPLSIIADLWSIRAALSIAGFVVLSYSLLMGIFSRSIRRLS